MGVIYDEQTNLIGFKKDRFEMKEKKIVNFCKIYAEEMQNSKLRLV